jgi:hypothetical protein
MPWLAFYLLAFIVVQRVARGQDNIHRWINDPACTLHVYFSYMCVDGLHFG